MFVINKNLLEDYYVCFKCSEFPDHSLSLLLVRQALDIPCNNSHGITIASWEAEVKALPHSTSNTTCLGSSTMSMILSVSLICMKLYLSVKSLPEVSLSSATKYSLTSS